MTSWFHRQSIRAQILLLAVAIMLPVIAMLAWFLSANLQHARDDAHDKVRLLANDTALTVERYLRQNEEVLGRLATRPLVRALDPNACDPLIGEYVRLRPEFVTLGLRDRQARVICSFLPNPPPAAQIVQSAWFRAGFTSDKYTAGNAIVGPATGRWVSIQTQPVRDDNGEVSGLFAMPVDLLTLGEDLLGGVPKNAVVRVVDRNFNVLMHSADAKSLTGRPSPEPAQEGMRGQERGFFTANGLDGVARLNAFVVLTNTGWRVVAGMPESEVFADYNAVLRRSLELGGLVLLMALALAWRMASAIVRPITNLASTTARIAAGDRTARVALAGSSEIAEVGQQFNLMLDKRDANEAALRLSEANLATAQAMAHVGSWELDLQTLTGTWSAENYRLHDRDPALGPPTYQEFLDLVHPDDRESTAQIQVRAATETGLITHQYRTNPQRGTERVLSVSMQAFRDADGRPLRMAGTSLDITERERAAEQLRQSEENLAITLQSIGDAVIATDTEGRVTRMNPTAERLTGWPLAQAQGSLLTDVFHIINAKTRGRCVNPVQLVMEHGQVVGLANHTALIAQDGREYQISDSAAPIRDAMGSIVGVVLVFSDVTEAYRIRQALDTTAELLERTGEVAKVGGWEFDLRTERLFWSKETCHIHELDPPVTPPLEAAINFYAPQARPIVRAAVQKSIEHGTPFDLELPMVTAKGRAIWVRTQCSPVMEDGTVVKLVGAFHDISDRKHVEQSLQISELRYRLAASSGQVWEWDITLNRTDFPAPFWHQLGHDAPKEQDFVTQLAKQMHPDDLPRWQQAVRDHLIHRTPYDLEYRARHANGHWLWFHTKGQAVWNDEGRATYMAGTTFDITTRKQAEESLRIAATAFESQQGMFVTDAAWSILEVNAAFTDITGYTKEEALGQTPFCLLRSGRHDDAFFEAMNASLAQTGAWQGEVWDRRKNGEIFPQWLTVTAVKNDEGTVTHYVDAFTDITSRKAAEDQIQKLAYFDPLTGLPNRRLLLERLKQAVAAGARRQNKGALLFVDLDNFKTLNDTLGHDMGDMLLQQVAQRLGACIREGDTVARLGGDEFVIMLEDLSENDMEAAAQAEHVGEKIRATLNQIYQLGSYAHHSTPSIGVTLFGGSQEGIEEPLKRADLAMYQAKAAGRNTLRFFDPQMQALVTARATLESGLREGLTHDQFVLFYQAQITRNAQGTHVVTGVEALVRWKPSHSELVSPADFIPLSEDTGLILPLGSWVLEEACNQLAKWAHATTFSHLVVAVNVSAHQFHQPNFVEQVLGILERTGANPRQLKLELTEGMLVSHIDDVIAKMTALKTLGVGFSLDDFGTGYSSLAHLKRLPLDQLKIDQSFVKDILSDPNDAAIARMVIALGDSLGLAVMAEGVETEAQREFLAAQGCHAYQGYLFSRPLPADEFETFIANN
jgi:diguanylate cyclase (GGDEF)-like protein/PAS domain S-box-containing protein